MPAMIGRYFSIAFPLYAFFTRPMSSFTIFNIAFITRSDCAAASLETMVAQRRTPNLPGHTKLIGQPAALHFLAACL